MKLTISLLVLCTIGVPLSSAAQVAGLSITGPSPWIDVTNAVYAAKGDAQLSNELAFPTTCSVNLGSFDLNCTAGQTTFAATDVGKFIEVPTAGASSTPPAPTATLLTRIDKFVDTTHVVLRDSAIHMATLVTVTWGTDNSTPVQSAMNACPQKGCVLYFPAGNYMFGSGVSMPTNTSFEILAQGNSGKWEKSFEAGVRLLTAMPITIMTLGQSSSLSQLGGFQLWNFTFLDSSRNGSALGGLLLIQTSESLIAEDNFENFNGQQADGLPGVVALSYGMKSDPGQGTNNNTILLHDKGKDNSVWYDASLPNQDGPIVIGGDIFPINHKSNGACYGILDSGPIRMFGTHFDVSTGSDGTACYGVRVIGGQVYGKFEASDSVGGLGTVYCWWAVAPAQWCPETARSFATEVVT